MHHSIDRINNSINGNGSLAVIVATVLYVVLPVVDNVEHEMKRTQVK